MKAVVVAPGEGRFIAVGSAGAGVTVKASAAETDGLCTVWEGRVPPGTVGAGPHYHRERDEFFYVLEGEMVLRIGEERHTAGAGTFAFVPHGTIHGFHNASGESATSAYRAIYKAATKSAEAHGCRLVRNGKVSARIAEMQQERQGAASGESANRDRAGMGLLDETISRTDCSNLQIQRLLVVLVGVRAGRVQLRVRVHEHREFLRQESKVVVADLWIDLQGPPSKEGRARVGGRPRDSVERLFRVGESGKDGRA